VATPFRPVTKGVWGYPTEKPPQKIPAYIWLFWQTSITNSIKGTTAKYGNVKPNEPCYLLIACLDSGFSCGYFLSLING